MRPHADCLHNPFFLEYLIDKAMLYVDSSRIGSSEISNKFLEWWWILERRGLQQFEQLLRFGFQAYSSQLPRILLRLFREDDLPAHQLSLSEHSSTDVLNPSRIDSRIPGMDSR